MTVFNAQNTEWKSHFYYDETSPTCLRWAREVRRGKELRILFKVFGDVAGSVSKGYSQVSLSGRNYKAARVVWELHNGPIELGLDIDHIDGDIHNNRIGNLRAVKTVVNTRNCRLRIDNKSGTAGISRVVKKGYTYWRVVWYSIECKRHELYFSALKLGECGAEASATKFALDKKIALNAQGAGYTNRHGKEVNACLQLQ
jgi:hypothetical protein